MGVKIGCAHAHHTPVMADAQLPSSRLADPLTRTGCSSRLRITYPDGSHAPDQAHNTPSLSGCWDMLHVSSECAPSASSYPFSFLLSWNSASLKYKTWP